VLVLLGTDIQGQMDWMDTLYPKQT
jgi:hypothetical protein